MYPITYIPMRGQPNHKREICNLFWSTLRYCLVLSESSMATQFYVVEFPSEDEKCRGPYLVPANKVKKENGTTQVLWRVVDELMGNIMEVYYEATCVKQGRKKECSDFLDLLKKNRQQAEISNKGGVRSCKKPAKLDYYEFGRSRRVLNLWKTTDQEGKESNNGNPIQHLY